MSTPRRCPAGRLRSRPGGSLPFRQRGLSARYRPEHGGAMDEYDVVVIGGGAAGLSGAVALGRSRRSVLVVDDGTPRTAPAEGEHNILSRDGTPPAAQLAAGR